MQRIIINAGRKHDTKWGLDTPKHFVEVNGERLLDRTIRQLKAAQDNGIPLEIIVAARTEAYQYPDTTFFPVTDKDTPLVQYFRTMPMWPAYGRVVLVLGDVWFTDAAMETILTHKDDPWTLFGRAGASDVTPKTWGEPFAVGLTPDAYPDFYQAMLDTVMDYEADQTKDCNIWNVYRHLIGVGPTDEHIIQGHFVEMNDGTDDIDRPRDVRWMETAIQTKKGETDG